MNGTLRINPSFAPILTRYGLDGLEPVMAFSGGTVMRQAPGRITVKVELPEDQVFYLKRHTHPSAQAGTAGVKEWDNLEVLNALDISCPVLVAAGSGTRNGAPCSFLITAAIPDAIPLDDYLRQLYDTRRNAAIWQTKRELIARLAELARRLHRPGFHHKDLYLCHVFVNRDAPVDGTLALIDLQRLGRARFFRRRWVVKDLAALNYSATPDFTTATDRLRFVLAYLGIARLTPAARSLIRSVQRKTERIRRHDLKLQDLCRTG